MEISVDFNEPAVKQSVGGFQSGIFRDDLTFTFNTKDVHITNQKKIDKMLADLDVAVIEFKKSARKPVES